MKKRQSKLTPFGKEVRKKLIDKGMTQVELATLIGCTKQYVYKILCGERSGKNILKRLQEYLILRWQRKRGELNDRNVCVIKRSG